MADMSIGCLKLSAVQLRQSNWPALGMSPMVLVKKSAAALPSALISTFEPLPIVLVAGSRLSLWPDHRSACAVQPVYE